MTYFIILNTNNTYTNIFYMYKIGSIIVPTLNLLLVPKQTILKQNLNSYIKNKLFIIISNQNSFVESVELIFKIHL